MDYRISIVVPLLILIVAVAAVGAAAPPEASFEYSPSTPNPDDSITLDASASSDEDGSIVSYEWDGDGDGGYDDRYGDDPSNGQTTTISFDSGGTYTVGLKVTDDNGDTQTTTKQITVENPAPTAEFSYTPSTPNPDDSITLDASASSDEDGSIVSYEWDGDGDGGYNDRYGDDPDNGQTSTISFDSGGTYTVGLKLTDNGGETRTTTKQITVENPAPTVEFSHTPSTPNPDDSITLNASASSDEDGSIVSYEWDGDGDGGYDDRYGDDPDNGQTSTISFGSGGTYTVGLKLTDNGGKTRTTTKQITVENPAPTVEFSYTPSTPNPDDSITLDASASSDEDGSIVSYEWDGDGDGGYDDRYGDDPDNGQTSTISFGSGGTYTVGLEITDNGGKTRTTTKQITVENPAPTVEFSYTPSTPNPDDSITLDASASSDEDGSIVSYKWDGDGDGGYNDRYGDDPDNGQTSTVSFGSGGTYTVGLKITDNGGKTQTTTKQITVENPAPTAEFSYTPSTPNPDDSITLDASASSDEDGSIVSYKWDGDGDGGYNDRYGDDPSNGQTSTISFGSEGTYAVGLKLTDNGGKSKATTKQITVKNTAPEPTFSFSTSNPKPDEKITLNAGESTDPDGEVVSYVWDGNNDRDYGDNRDPAGGQTTSISFDTEGTYTVRLKVADNGEKSATVFKTIEVTNTEPEPRFEYAISESDGLRVTFDATSSQDPDGKVVRYEWYVEGDRIQRGQRTDIEFTRKGSYEVRLVVYDNGAKQASTTQTVGVSKVPRGEITLPQTPVATGQSTEFKATEAVDPDGSIARYEWTLSDGTERRGESIERIFTDPGTYTVTLELTDERGTSQTLSKSFTVREPPEASFDWGPKNPEDDTEIEFSATPSTEITKYEWDFGADDSIDAEGQTASRSFSDGGEREVQLYAYGQSGVVNRVTRTVDVREVPPEVSLNWAPEVPRDGQDVVFNVSSPDEITEYQWDFNNDGEFDAAGGKVSNSFDESGRSVVAVRAEDATGDTKTLREPIRIQKSASFDVSSVQSQLQPGNSTVVQFNSNNNIRDEVLEVKLRFDLPESGVSVSSVSGGELVSSSSTNFVSIDPGDSETLQIRLQFNEPGDYSLTGTAVYYHGESGDDRRTTDVGPIAVTVQDPASGSAPGFGIPLTLISIVVGILVIRRRSSR